MEVEERRGGERERGKMEEAGPGPGPEAQQDDRPTVLILAPLFPAFAGPLSSKFRLLSPADHPDLPLPDFLAGPGAAARLLLVGLHPVDAATIRAIPALECVVGTSAGLDHIDLAECRRRGIAVTNVGPVFADDTADYAVGMLLDVLRRVSAADRYVRSGRWAAQGDYPLGSSLRGKKVGIVGLGNIGSKIAKRLQPFGCSISYCSKKEKPSFLYQYFSDVRDLATSCEVLVVSCALTDETYHIINKEVLSALGKGGIVINVGRGALIDEKELVRCLVEGEIGGAGLDVFENEPKVPQELMEMDNVVLSPHRAVLTPEAVSGVIQLIVANMEAFFANKPLLSAVAL